MRVEKNAAQLTLSTTWQRIMFGDANPRNTNSFPVESNGQHTVAWDAANGLFKFSAPEDRNYRYQFYGKFTCSNPITLLTAAPIQVQFRLVIPNGISAGVAATLPFPGLDGLDGYGTLGLVNFNAETRMKDGDIIYASSNIRTNGVGFDMRVSAVPVLGSVKLTLATALIYG